MTQSSLLAFAVVGQQAEETREQRQALQRAREERKKQALELLGLPWPEPTRKGSGSPACEDQYQYTLQCLALLTSLLRLLPHHCKSQQRGLRHGHLPHKIEQKLLRYLTFEQKLLRYLSRSF